MARNDISQTATYPIEEITDKEITITKKNFLNSVKKKTSIRGNLLTAHVVYLSILEAKVFRIFCKKIGLSMAQVIKASINYAIENPEKVMEKIRKDRPNLFSKLKDDELYRKITKKIPEDEN